MSHVKKKQVLSPVVRKASVNVTALGLMKLKNSRPLIRRIFVLVVAVGVVQVLCRQWKFVQQLANTNKSINGKHSMTSSRRLIGRMRGGRLGNEMFVYASLIGIARRNKMNPVFYGRQLRMWFRLTAEESSVSEVDSVSEALTELSPNKVDSRFDKLDSMFTGDVIIVGFFQCWRYFDRVRSFVQREFQFSSGIQEATRKFLRTNTRLDGDVVYIGVHIRRGDMLSDYNVDRGYTVADEDYLQRAVTYMIVRLAEQRTDDTKSVDIVFVVCSDDIEWSEEHFTVAVSRSSVNVIQPSTTFVTTDWSHNRTSNDRFNSGFSSGLTDMVSIFTPTLNNNIPSVRIQIIHSPGFADGQDLALLAQCNHTIMTVGTFGWWAGYLAGGTTVYYKDFPAESSSLHYQFNKDDYFPPDWIGL